MLSMCWRGFESINEAVKTGFRCPGLVRHLYKHHPTQQDRLHEPECLNIGLCLSLGFRLRDGLSLSFSVNLDLGISCKPVSVQI